MSQISRPFCPISHLSLIYAPSARRLHLSFPSKQSCHAFSVHSRGLREQILLSVAVKDMTTLGQNLPPPPFLFLPVIFSLHASSCIHRACRGRVAACRLLRSDPSAHAQTVDQVTRRARRPKHSSKPPTAGWLGRLLQATHVRPDGSASSSRHACSHPRAHTAIRRLKTPAGGCKRLRCEPSYTCVTLCCVIKAHM